MAEIDLTPKYPTEPASSEIYIPPTVAGDNLAQNVGGFMERKKLF